MSTFERSVKQFSQRLTQQTKRIMSLFQNNTNETPHQILMLGGRRSGKSSILASIVYSLDNYANLFTMNDQTDYSIKDGLGIPLSEKRIEIDNYLRKHKSSPKNSRFLVDMSPNKGEGIYHLETQIQGKAKVTFEFVDVSGENMEVTSEHHARLKEHVKKSDVFIVAIDTPYLMQDDNENINTVWNRTDEITNLLSNITIADENLDKKLIIFCPVKCEKWTQSGQAEKVTERVCKAYRKLINNWVHHSAVDLWVMPIETAGGLVHSKLLDGYELFRNAQDKTGEMCSINDQTGQIMLKDGMLLQPSDNYTISDKPSEKLLFSATQIPLSWYTVNGKGFSPAKCEQPALHVLRFLVRKEENLMRSEGLNMSLLKRIWIWLTTWAPPFGKELKAYGELIDKLENNHLIKNTGDGFANIIDYVS